MTDWIVFAVYVTGWLIACRVLAGSRYAPEARDGGLFMLGVGCLLWPAMVVIGLFILPVWLVTRGVDRG